MTNILSPHYFSSLQGQSSFTSSLDPLWTLLWVWKVSKKVTVANRSPLLAPSCFHFCKQLHPSSKANKVSIVYFKWTTWIFLLDTLLNKQILRKKFYVLHSTNIWVSTFFFFFFGKPRGGSYGPCDVRSKVLWSSVMINFVCQLDRATVYVCVCERVSAWG